MDDPASKTSTAPPAPWALTVYGTGMSLLRPALGLLLRHRERQGKEERARRGERLGIPGRPRPAGPLVWIHAASVGELNAALPLLNGLLDARPGLSALVTTGTVTSARVAADRLPARAVHQYVPIDTPAYVRRFLDAWQPELAILTEQEIWPSMLLDCHTRSIPVVLVNARMSARTLARWRRRPAVAAALFGRIDLVLTQTPELAEAFTALGARAARTVGSLKVDAPTLAVPARLRADVEALIGDRACLLAASTHDGEEAIVAAAHRLLRGERPDHLTVIVPRHPERGATLAATLVASGLRVARRSLGERPDRGTDVYLADTIGELGAFYALAPVALIGGSLANRGGQNPVEALRLGAAVLVGLSRHNFEEIYAPLIGCGGAVEVRSASDIAHMTRHWLGDEAARRLSVERGLAMLANLGGALGETLAAVLALLPEAGPAHAQSKAPSGQPMA